MSVLNSSTSICASQTTATAAICEASIWQCGCSRMKHALTRYAFGQSSQRIGSAISRICTAESAPDECIGSGARHRHKSRGF
jgi:hypothetical protein